MISGLEIPLLTRAIIAAVLGFVIGWERESCGSPAGDRTCALVALGAAVFTSLSMNLFPGDTPRVIAGVVTGVGFLGAGVIMRQNTGEVRGLTTAASVWVVAGIGVTIGLGYFLPGLLLAVLVLLILSWEELPLLSRIGYRKKRHRPGDLTE